MNPKIEKAMEEDGCFSHNKIGVTLLLLAREEGYEAANKLVDEYNLTELYEIPKMEVENDDKIKVG